MFLRSVVPASAVAVLCCACGGAPAAPPTTAQEGSSPAPAPAATAAPAAKSSQAPAAAASSGAADTYDDPAEAQEPVTLVPLFTKAKSPQFPKATLGERECWETVPITGVAQKDHDALVARCGTPTGSVEYVKPSAGKLHHAKDKRDAFVVHVIGGLCYRFFGVADGSIGDLDILIQQTNGSLVGEDRTHGPVAIIDTDKAWCMDRDGDYQFNVQVGGTGTGNYVFGVWARPLKQK
jgi:hypothetical protein